MTVHPATIKLKRLTRRQRRGQALIEFAVIALVLYLLIGAAITFGHWILVSGQLQQAAQVAARELSQTPLPPDMTFEEALDQGEVRRRIYDDRWLVIDLDRLALQLPNGNFFVDVVPRMPLLNQQLATSYIYQEITIDPNEPPQRFLRYPGALLTRSDVNLGVNLVPADNELPEYVRTELLVQIPLVISRATATLEGGGAERIRWLDVVEEIDTEETADADAGTNYDPFSLNNGQNGQGGAVPPQGVVALRIHFPAQSPWLSSYRDKGRFVPNIGAPNVADDANVIQLNSPKGVPFDPGTGSTLNAGAATYGGNYGLGLQQAMTAPALTGNNLGVRPYRRVLVSQAIFRREAFR